MPRRRHGIVVSLEPPVIVSQRERFAVTDGSPIDSLETLVTFVPGLGEATDVRPKDFDPTPIEWDPTRQWSAGRWGVVVVVYDDQSLSIIDGDAGVWALRDYASDVEVGDEVTYDLMSDLQALSLRVRRRRGTKSKRAQQPPTDALSPADYEALLKVRDVGLLADFGDDRLPAEGPEIDPLELARAHWLSSKSADDALHAPASIAAAHGIDALDGILTDEGGVVSVHGAGTEERFRPRTLGQWVGLYDHALRVSGDPRRMLGLREDTDDLEEMTYLLVTHPQRAVLETIGWADPMHHWEPPPPA